LWFLNIPRRRRGLPFGIVSAYHQGDWSYGSWDRIPQGRQLFNRILFLKYWRPKFGEKSYRFLFKTLLPIFVKMGSPGTVITAYSCFVGGVFLLALRPKFSPFWAKKEVKMVSFCRDVNGRKSRWNFRPEWKMMVKIFPRKITYEISRNTTGSAIHFQ
jgi:hypothetical protein